MKRGVLTFLILTILMHAPWRLFALAAETLWVHPGLAHISQENDKYYETMALAERLNAMGWTVSYQRNLAMMTMGGPIPVYGLTNMDDHTIRVDASLSWNARYSVLAHEGGHTLQRGWYTRAAGETFAEAVSAVVTRDQMREHARYLAAFKMDALWVLLLDSSAIYHAAAVLEDE